MEDYLTILQTVKTQGVPERLLRRMVKAGNVEGFYSGNRFYVYIPTLRDTLARMGKERVSVTQ